MTVKSKDKPRPENLLIKNRDMYNKIRKYDRNEMELLLQRVWLEGYVKGKEADALVAAGAEAAR